MTVGAMRLASQPLPGAVSDSPKHFVNPKLTFLLHLPSSSVVPRSRRRLVETIPTPRRIARTCARAGSSPREVFTIKCAWVRFWRLAFAWPGHVLRSSTRECERGRGPTPPLLRRPASPSACRHIAPPSVTRSRAYARWANSNQASRFRLRGSGRSVLGLALRTAASNGAGVLGRA